MVRKFFVVIMAAITIIAFTQSSEAAQPSKKSAVHIVKKDKITYEWTWATGLIGYGSILDAGDRRPDLHVYREKAQNRSGPCAGIITKRTVVNVQTIEQHPIKFSSIVFLDGKFAFVYGKLKIIRCGGEGTKQYWEEINIILLTPPTILP